MGPELIETIRNQAKRFGAQFDRGMLNSVDFSKRPFQLNVDSLGEIYAESVIISTGASSRMLQITGERENLGHGISTCVTCDGFFFRNKKVIVIDGGDFAIEESTFLTKFASEVRVVHLRNELRVSKIMQERAKENQKISWRFNHTPIETVSGDKKVTGLKVVRNNDTGEEKILEAEGIFLAIGHIPYADFLQSVIDVDTFLISLFCKWSHIS